jgi:hypothetical protein
MKRILLTAAAVAAAALLLWRWAPAPHALTRVAADDDDQPPAASSRVSMHDGVAVITLDAKAQAAAGIRVAPLGATSDPPQAEAPATVLDTTPLVAARAQFIADQAAMAKAQAAVTVAHKEQQRLQRLFEQQQNASAKQVEAAQGTLDADQADLAAAQQTVALSLDAVRANWGGVIAGWVEHGSPQLDALLARHTALLAVTLDGAGAAPAKIEIQAFQHRVPATLVSPSPHADVRLQGWNLLYLAPAQPGLATGLNLTALLPQGPPARGVLVPQAAIVWWQGAPWAFERTSATTFVREPVPSDHAVPGGLFAASGFKRGDQVVVAGAAALLSEELRAQIQTED